MIRALLGIMLVGAVLVGALIALAMGIWAWRAASKRNAGCICPWNWFWGFHRQHDCPVHGRPRPGIRVSRE